MNRRSFLQTLTAVVVAPLVAAAPAAAKPAPLAFHPLAFSSVFDPPTGVSMRLVKSFAQVQG